MPRAAGSAKGKAAAGGAAAGGADKPKRPLSAFFLFSQAQRQEIKKKHPDWKVSDIAKELGRIWGTMSDQQKSKYQQEAAVNKEKYDRLIGKTAK